MERHIWEVDLVVYGPISISRSIEFNEPKGYRLHNPFYSDVVLKRSAFGVEATVTAYASTDPLAEKAALLFFGEMLDVLSTKTNTSLVLSLKGGTSIRTSANREHRTRRRIERNEWQDAFYDARLLALSEPVYLRALGWYRKGLYTEDPFDKFLALWNAIEIVAQKYHPPVPADKPKGSKSHVWECFKAIWGPCSSWPIIPNDTTWIDKSYEARTNIAHGLRAVDVEAVEALVQRIDTIQAVAHRFLQDWRRLQLRPVVPPELESRFR